jgi:putative pyruvate formate lyase activating enzyme
MSGYQSRESLKLIECTADIYLPDFKYADPNLARKLTGTDDYPDVALEALSEMVRQKGFLDSPSAVWHGQIGEVEDQDDPAVAQKGVLVRHLILPGHIQNSIKAIEMLFIEFGADLPLSLMTQYVPVYSFLSGSPLNRRVTAGEFRKVLEHVEALGFRRVFVQRPERRNKDSHPFLPDFRSKTPFGGNNAKRGSTAPWT